MGKLEIKPHIKIDYTPEIIAGWKSLSAENKAIFEEKGKPFGYTGINVFYFTVIAQASIVLGGSDPNNFFWHEVQ